MIYLTILKLIVAACVIMSTMLGGCEPSTEPPPEEEPEPYFKPGEYGGDPLEGTEHLYNFHLSPDGSQIALIRAYTPGEPLAPRDQLWILNADGTEPRLIGYNIGTVDWSPDGEKLAITFIIGFHNTYVITFDYKKEKGVRIWSGLDDDFLYEQTTSNPRWFNDGNRLLVSVWGKAYKQSYDRGVYIINTETQNVEGPLVEVSAAALLGSNENFFISRKYLKQGEPLNGNYIRYDFTQKKWFWLTDFPDDSLNRWVKQPVPNPQGPKLIYSRHLENAWQLFWMDKKGNEIEQITELGGSQPRWSSDGTKIFFNRDTHKAPGARFIPHEYQWASGNIDPLWPNLPDSVPEFPSLETQDPVDFYQIVQDSSSER